MAQVLNFKAMLLVLLGVIFFFALSQRAYAQVPGEVVKCGCYCGVMLDPPCSDDDCKRACGYQEGDQPSPSQGSGEKKSLLWMIVMSGILLFVIWLVLFGFPVPASPV